MGEEWEGGGWSSRQRERDSGRRRQRRQTRHAAARIGAVCIGVRVLPGAPPHMCRYPPQPLPLPRRRLRQDALTEPTRSRHGR